MRVKFHRFCSLSNLQPLKECFPRVCAQRLADWMNGELGVREGSYFRMNKAPCHKILTLVYFWKYSVETFTALKKESLNIRKIIKVWILSSWRKVTHWIPNDLRRRNLNWEARQCAEVFSERFSPTSLHPLTMSVLALFFFFTFYFLSFLLSDSLLELLELELWLIQSCLPRIWCVTWHTMVLNKCFLTGDTALALPFLL